MIVNEQYWFDLCETMRTDMALDLCDTLRDRTRELDRMGVSYGIRADHDLLRLGVSDLAWRAMVHNALTEPRRNNGDARRFGNVKVHAHTNLTMETGRV